MKIVHVTSTHNFRDSRIFEKECISLSNAGYEIYLIAPDAPNATIENINVLGFNKPIGMVARTTIGLYTLYKKVKETDADVLHIHDPELIILGLALKMSGKKVVYDVHENFLDLVTDRKWIPKIFQLSVKLVLTLLQKLSGKYFDGIVVATPKITKNFPPEKCYLVRNMPVQELFNIAGPGSKKEHSNTFCYVGGLSRERGIFDIINAIGNVKGHNKHLVIGGGDHEPFEQEAQAMDGGKHTTFLGFISRERVAAVYADAVGGLVTLHETDNHKGSLPIKLFEYMAAGLPVIATDFPEWKQIVEGNVCGICVPAKSPQKIKSAMEFIIDNPEIALKMGKNGKKAVIKKYNWKNEESKLLEMYSSLN